nr:reverse transcriptase domain-containing protein [Tanacetum cinerariifolium]
MRTRFSSNLPVESPPNPSTSNPKCRNRRRSKQPFILEESSVDTMADQRNMAELLRAPTEGYTEAIVVPPILAEQFERKHSLINMMTSDQFFGLEKDNPHDHIRWDNIQGYVTTAVVNYNQGNSVYRPLAMQTQINNVKNELRNEVKNSIQASMSNQTNELKNMMAGFFQMNTASTLGSGSLPSNTINPGEDERVEETLTDQDLTEYTIKCLAADRNTFPELRDNIQGYVAAAAVNYNQVVPLSELEKVKRINEANMKAMQTQINNVKNELRNEMKNSIQASMSNQTNELKNMMASFFQMNTASTSGLGSLPSNTIANPKGELKAITTRSGIVLDGPSVLIPPLLINPEEDERVEETLTDQDLAEDPLHPNIPYPSTMHKQKQQEKDEVQIHKSWQMFKQLHINITFTDALILIPKYQKMLKALLSNKEKVLEPENTPLNENCSAVILKKLPKKLGDPGKFLILCGFSELKCKSLANLGASINLMPLSIWKKLGLPGFISTRMTLELANRAIYTPAGIARDVFISVGKFTFPTDFVIVDYESDPRVPFILGRPFIWTARALIDAHGEEMILHDGDERLTLNMRHDTSSYSNQP